MNTTNNHRHRKRERQTQGIAVNRRDRAIRQIDRDQDMLDKQSAIATRAAFMAGRTYTSWLKSWKALPESYTSPRRTIRLYFVLLGTISVVIINLLLIQAPVIYLVKLGGMSGFWKNFATIAFPIILLIFELSTGSHLQRALDNDDEEEERTQKRVGWLLICFTPLMILGTYIAGGALVKPFNWVLMIALMLLAGVTDASIVNGYEQIEDAYGFALSRFLMGTAKWKVYRQERKFSNAKNNVVRVFPRLARVYARHNESYPQTPIPTLAITPSTGWFVNHAIGREAIEDLPPKPPEPNFDFFNNLVWGEDSSNIGTDFGDRGGNPNPARPDRNPDEGDREDTEAERDFYRDQLRRNAQQNEREVRP